MTFASFSITVAAIHRTRLIKSVKLPLHWTTQSCVGIPKTVDNDLPITDCSPGFGSAAKYVATSIREAAFDVASMSRTSTKVFALEVMGRHAGWMTAACALAAEEDGGAPHILLLPEVTFN